MQLKHDSVVVVTGAGSGIGRALAIALHAAGCRLAMADWSATALAALADGLHGDSDRVLARSFDVGNRAAMQDFASDVADRFGHVDALFNNAGVSHAHTVAELDYDDLDWVMQTNFFGMVHGAKAFLPGMLEAGHGQIVFVSSVFGIVSVPTQAAYSASKFAIRGFAEALREEVRPRGVHVLVVCPGSVKTSLIRSGRIKDGSAIGSGDQPPADAFEQAARTTPEQAAAHIVRAVERGRRRLLIGADAIFLDALQRLFPGSCAAKLQRLIGRTNQSIPRESK